jgi:hypothetical protein
MQLSPWRSSKTLCHLDSAISCLLGQSKMPPKLLAEKPSLPKDDSFGKSAKDSFEVAVALATLWRYQAVLARHSLAVWGSRVAVETEAMSFVTRRLDPSRVGHAHKSIRRIAVIIRSYSSQE